MRLQAFIAKIKADFTKDSQYLFNTVIISLMILAILCTIEPYLNTGDSIIKQVRRVEKEMIDVRPEKLQALLQSQSGKPSMMIFYASWCGYCKKVMPVVVQMLRDHQLDNVEPVFVSLDTQPRKLSQYIVNKGYSGVYKPYRLDQDFGTLSEFVVSTGSSYRGAIPYMAFFRPDGELIVDAAGVVTKQDILAIANQLKN